MRVLANLAIIALVVFGAWYLDYQLSPERRFRNAKNTGPSPVKPVEPEPEPKPKLIKVEPPVIPPVKKPTEIEWPREVENSLGMQFMLIPNGSFAMGSPENEVGRGDDELLHDVTISKRYYFGKFEVTQRQFERVMGFNPSFFAPQGAGKAVLPRDTTTGNHPVECVTFAQALEFCKRLADMEDEREMKYRYRLPTEAEWEYACRAGMTSAFHLGDALNSMEANFNGFPDQGKVYLRATVPVGNYRMRNNFGLQDMHGNVSEWCADWYDADAYRFGVKTDPTGPRTGIERVIRGGGWANTTRMCRSAARNKLSPEEPHYSVGIRVVLMVPNGP